MGACGAGESAGCAGESHSHSHSPFSSSRADPDADHKGIVAGDGGLGEGATVQSKAQGGEGRGGEGLLDVASSSTAPRLDERTKRVARSLAGVAAVTAQAVASAPSTSDSTPLDRCASQTVNPEPYIQTLNSHF